MCKHGGEERAWTGLGSGLATKEYPGGTRRGQRCAVPRFLGMVSPVAFSVSLLCCPLSDPSGVEEPARKQLGTLHCKIANKTLSFYPHISQLIPQMAFKQSFC